METDGKRYRGRLGVRSAANPDWNGDWNEEEVRREMAELGLGNGEDWAEYVLCHVFDGLPDAVSGAMRPDCVRKASFTVGFGEGTAEITVDKGRGPA